MGTCQRLCHHRFHHASKASGGATTAATVARSPSKKGLMDGSIDRRSPPLTDSGKERHLSCNHFYPLFSVSSFIDLVKSLPLERPPLQSWFVRIWLAPTPQNGLSSLINYLMTENGRWKEENSGETEKQDCEALRTCGDEGKKSDQNLLLSRQTCTIWERDNSRHPCYKLKYTNICIAFSPC